MSPLLLSATLSALSCLVLTALRYFIEGASVVKRLRRHRSYVVYSKFRHECRPSILQLLWYLSTETLWYFLFAIRLSVAQRRSSVR